MVLDYAVPRTFWGVIRGSYFERRPVLCELDRGQSEVGYSDWRICASTTCVVLGGVCLQEAPDVCLMVGYEI